MVKRVFSLREKKFAKTKVAIINELVRRLETIHFEDISISEICEEIEVSEGTFYNYFPHKTDVIIYFQVLSLIYLRWYVNEYSREKDVFSDLKLFFEGATKKFKNQNLIYELIAVFWRENRESKPPIVSALEIKYAFPKCVGIEEMIPQKTEDYFKQLIVQAIKNGELPKKTNVYDMVVSLLTIFYGTVLALQKKEFKLLKEQYNKQLMRLWAGSYTPTP